MAKFVYHYCLRTLAKDPRDDTFVDGIFVSEAQIVTMLGYRMMKEIIADDLRSKKLDEANFTVISLTFLGKEEPENSQYPWQNHDDYPMSDWQYEVANGDTVLGYQEWREAKLESDRAERGE